MGAHVYMLRCRDGSFYVGLTSQEDLAVRIAQHQSGAFPGSYTDSRRPVKLVWSDYFADISAAIDAERQLKGWSRAKKEALINGGWENVSKHAKRRGGKPRESPSSNKP